MFASASVGALPPQPAPVANRRAREEAAQAKVRHLVGRPLVPFYLPDMSENGDLELAMDQDFGVEEMEFRAHTEGFFQEPQSAHATVRGEQQHPRPRSQSTPNTPLPSSFSSSKNMNNGSKAKGKSKRSNTGQISPSPNTPQNKSPALLSLNQQQHKVT
jgi:hypothetical protein